MHLKHLVEFDWMRPICSEIIGLVLASLQYAPFFEPSNTDRKVYGSK